MRDVARVADVSLATVSRVLNGQGEVRDDLAARVRDAVRVLAYRRDLTASTLRRSDRMSASIGLIVDDVANPFFAMVLRGIEDAARERGVLAYAGSSDQDPARERELTDDFASRGVDGLVVAPSDVGQGYLQREVDAGIAVVFVDRPPRFLDADSVLGDSYGGGRAAMAVLLGAGHRRIAFLGDRPELYTAIERHRGYREALEEAGLRVEPELGASNLTSARLAAEATRTLMAGPAPPTALFTSQNLITMGAVRALHELGRADDVALVGFDDVELGDVVRPGITVVRQDPPEMGRRAAERLFERLDGYAGPGRREVVPVKVVRRASGELPGPESRRP